jgi:hypothetical protein
MKNFLIHALFALTIPLSAQAASQTLTVVADDAPLYASPSTSGAPTGKVKKGQLIQGDGTQQDGFHKLVTRSGKPLWIRAIDVSSPNVPNSASDIVAGSPTVSTRAQARSFRRITYDFGASTGISGGSSSYEVHFGLNYFFAEWLSWRNAPFFHVRTGYENYYGLDSSLRGAYSPDLGEGFSPTLTLGAGYRLASAGQSAPFAESMLLLRTAGLNIGAGVKIVLDSVVSTRENQVFLSFQLAGGGAL